MRAQILVGNLRWLERHNPSFRAGEMKTAIAQLLNPTSSILPYKAELYLNKPKVATSGTIFFNIDAGASKKINFPLTMPTVAGTYLVFLDIFSDSQLISAYQGDEDVIIASVYRVAISFERERVCATSRGTECLEWSSEERQGIISIVNEGAPGQFRATLEYWWYLEGRPHNHFLTKEWTNYFAIGQTWTDSFTYPIPITGMAVDTRFFIKVYDPDGKVIADKVFQTPL